MLKDTIARVLHRLAKAVARWTDPNPLPRVQVTVHGELVALGHSLYQGGPEGPYHASMVVDEYRPSALVVYETAAKTARMGEGVQVQVYGGGERLWDARMHFEELGWREDKLFLKLAGLHKSLTLVGK